MNVALPKPLWAFYPDHGADVSFKFTTDPADRITAHEDGTLRVWRAAAHKPEWPYYPVAVVGMTDEETERALNLAKTLLAMPNNRQARRAMQ